MVIRLAFLVFACFSLAISLAAQCVQDHRTDTKKGILLNDLSIVGPSTLTSAELAGIAGEMAGSCYDEDSDELGERLRMLFQNRGYFTVEVKFVHLKPADPLGIPKPVVMEAEVSEGLRYKCGEIEFVNNHAFTSERLKQEFALKPGDWFSRDKVASGIEGLRKLYSSGGFLDYSAVPKTQPSSNATVKLTLDVREGPQYHLEKVEFLAEKQLAARLRSQWKLDTGSPYDQTYIDKYIEANQDLLPTGFGRDGVQFGTNCPEASVEVRFVIDRTEDSSKSKSKNVPCEKNKKSKSSDSQ